MPGVSSSNSAACASFDAPIPDIGDVRGAGPNRATVGFLISPKSGSLSVDGVTSVLTGFAGAAGPPAAGTAALPAPEPAGAADPAAGAADPAAGFAGASDPAAGAADPAAGFVAGAAEPAAGFAGAADP